MLSLIPELLVNIAHIGKVNEDKLAHSRIQFGTLGVKYGKYPRASLAQTMARWVEGLNGGPVKWLPACHASRFAAPADVRSAAHCEL
jgi:hypothetical protein